MGSARLTSAGPHSHPERGERRGESMTTSRRQPIPQMVFLQASTLAGPPAPARPMASLDEHAVPGPGRSGGNAQPSAPRRRAGAGAANQPVPPAAKAAEPAPGVAGQRVPIPQSPPGRSARRAAAKAAEKKRAAAAARTAAAKQCARCKAPRGRATLVEFGAKFYCAKCLKQERRRTCSTCGNVFIRSPSRPRARVCDACLNQPRTASGTRYRTGIKVFSGGLPSLGRR